MMQRLEDTTHKFFKYGAYVIAIVLGVLLAFLSARETHDGRAQILIGDQAHADGPPVDGDAAGTGFNDSGSGPTDSGTGGTDGGGGSDAGCGGTDGGGGGGE